MGNFRNYYVGVDEGEVKYVIGNQYKNFGRNFILVFYFDARFLKSKESCRVFQEQSLGRHGKTVQPY